MPFSIVFSCTCLGSLRGVCIGGWPPLNLPVLVLTVVNMCAVDNLDSY